MCAHCSDAGTLVIDAWNRRSVAPDMIGEMIPESIPHLFLHLLAYKCVNRLEK